MAHAYVGQSVDADPETADLTLALGWPGFAESASVLALAIRLRWADPQAPQRYRVRAAALRVATLACLGVLAVTAAQILLATVLFAVAPPDALSSGSPTELLVGVRPDAWSVLRQFSYVLWVPVLVLAALGGRRRTCWAAAVGAAPVVVAVISMICQPHSAPFGLSEGAVLVVQVAVLLGLVAMATAPRKASHQSPNRWPWTVGAIGLAAWAVFLVVGRLRPGSPLVTAFSYTIVDSAGMWCAAAMILALSLLVRGGGATRRARRRCSAWLGSPVLPSCCGPQPCRTGSRSSGRAYRCCFPSSCSWARRSASPSSPARSA